MLFTYSFHNWLLRTYKLSKITSLFNYHICSLLRLVFFPFQSLIYLFIVIDRKDTQRFSGNSPWPNLQASKERPLRLKKTKKKQQQQKTVFPKCLSSVCGSRRCLYIQCLPNKYLLHTFLTLLHPERPKPNRVLVVLRAIGLNI